MSSEFKMDAINLVLEQDDNGALPLLLSSHYVHFIRGLLTELGNKALKKRYGKVRESVYLVDA